MSDMVESMFSAREVPWHGLGTIVDDNLTASNAIVAAGLDWTVDLRPLYASLPGGKTKVRVDGKKAVMRDVDSAILGIVSDIYNTFQNVDAFSFLDALVDSGEAKYETAGSLRDGRTIFITLRIPNAIMIGGEDPHDLYLVLTTTHDGTGAVKVLVTPVRVVCMNTLTMAINGSKNRWSIAHNRTMDGRISEARETLDLSFGYMDAFNQKAEEMMRKKVSDDQFHDIVSDLFAPHNKDTEPAIEIVMDLWQNSPTNGYHGSAWGGFNALTEFFEHNGRQRSLEARLGAITGWQDKFRTRSADALLSA